MRQTSISFKSKGAVLEGVLASPQGLSGPFPAVAVCHPHPLFGGDMENGLVLAVCRALSEKGFMTLRFNFRGVGNSEGEFTKGERELDDVDAALDLLRGWRDVDRKRLGLMGYSFGASMVLGSLSRYKAARAFALVAPPLASVDANDGGGAGKPMLFIVGDRDRLVPGDSLKEKVGSAHPSAELVTVAGADHSWRGHEDEAARRVADFFVNALRR